MTYAHAAGRPVDFSAHSYFDVPGQRGPQYAGTASRYGRATRHVFWTAARLADGQPKFAAALLAARDAIQHRHPFD